MTSDQGGFRAKNITRERERLCIMMEELVHQEDVGILNVYIPNNRAAKHVKQNLIMLKGETDKSTIIAGEFSISLLND